MALDSDRLLEDIRRTGFPAELRVAAAFRSKGWKTAHRVGFVDLDHKNGRQISLRCHRLFTDPKTDIAVGSYLSIEVKKSLDKPWVIFCSIFDEDEAEGIELQCCTRNFDRELLNYNDLMAEHPVRTVPDIGRAAYEGMTQGLGAADISSALVLGVKSAIDERMYCERLLGEEFDDEVDDDEDEEDDGSPWLAVFSPLVIVEGDLWRCSIDANGEVAIAKANYIPYILNASSEAYGNEAYCLDIISSAFLQDYIKLQERWAASVAETIKRKLSRRGTRR